MMTVTDEIGKAFGARAAEYERVALIQNEIGKRLMARLEYLKIQPQRILDLGCGTGLCSKALALRYPKAQIVSLDLAHAMVLETKKKQNYWRKWSLLTANMMQLPFEQGVFDLVFSNQAVHWGDSLHAVFRELNRVMKPNACLMFSTLGPDSFKEIRQAWSAVDAHAHVNEFSDLHDVGDALLQEHFLDPVVDMELITMHYKTLPQMVHALKGQGVRNIHPSRNKGLTGRASWNQFLKHYPMTEEKKYPLTYEVVYGHAWRGQQLNTKNGTQTFISIAEIQKPRS
jgi:malonyl-CoA O-methyltransferase